MAEPLQEIIRSSPHEEEEEQGDNEVFSQSNALVNSAENDSIHGLQDTPALDDFEIVPNATPVVPSETLYNRRAFTSREILKAKLKYHYMNPWQKYKAKGRKPWKLFIQILKIVIVTVQVRV